MTPSDSIPNSWAVAGIGMKPDTNPMSEGDVPSDSRTELAPPAARGGSDPAAFLSPPRGPDEIGWLSHYRVIKVLGRGGMGIVFLAEDSKLQRHVALKVMRLEMASESMRKRFIREARACARLDNPHIVTIYQVDEERGIPFLAMQYLKGMPLNLWLKQQVGVSLAEVLRIGQETASGLATAHSEGLIHRDIKTANLWVESPSGRIKLLDFGLALPVEDQEEEGLTESGQILGTPGFMSPEQANGDDIDCRSDIFSFGCVLYELAAGKPPYAGKGLLALIRAMATETPLPLHLVNPNFPESFGNLVARMMDRNRDLRPQSADEVRSALQVIDAKLRVTQHAETVIAPITPTPLPAPEAAAPASTVAAPSIPGSGVVSGAKSSIPGTGVRPPPPPQEPTPVAKNLPLIFGVSISLCLVVGAVIYFNRTRADAPPALGTAVKSTETASERPAKKNSPPPPVAKEPEQPLDERDRDEFRRLPAAEQRQRLVRELRRWNPAFDGRLVLRSLPSGAQEAAIEADWATLSGIQPDSLANLTPLRALPELTQVSIDAKGKPVNLKGLAGLPLTRLECKNGHVDLNDLGEMKSLQQLDLSGSRVANLVRLRDYSLSSLSLNQTGLDNLAALRPLYTLRRLEIRGLPISSLDDMKELKLEHLDFSDCPGITKIEALETMPLTSIHCTYQPGFGKILAKHPTLGTINGQRKSEFLNQE